MRYLVIVFLVVFSFTAYSQYQIEGRVFDHESKKPLEFCNVFINGTTQGTQTDTSGYFNLREIPIVEIELVISYVGYESFSKIVNFSKSSKLEMEISLMPLVNRLSDFEVKAKVDKTWVKQLKKFKSEFLGSNELAKKCNIENTYVLDFNEREGIFTATAKESLKIINMALGYELSFEIKEFETSKTSFKIYGNVLFKEIIPKNKDEEAYWYKNRENAYFRSSNFFFKSIITEKLEQNGFELYVERPGNLSKRTDNLNLELTKSLMKFKPEGLLNNGKHPTLKTISLPDNIEIHNRFLKSPLKTYLQYLNAVSWMSLSKKSIRVTNSGVPLNPAEIMVSGDMNYFKVAGLLPLNFDLNATPKE